ncbi:MAG: hypothetical protein HQK89_16410 [Nitrospirae bacterium]|nr:hypothetical protein [Nitrospirota bacterium]
MKNVSEFGFILVRIASYNLTAFNSSDHRGAFEKQKATVTAFVPLPFGGRHKFFDLKAGKVLTLGRIKNPSAKNLFIP